MIGLPDCILMEVKRIKIAEDNNLKLQDRIHREITPVNNNACSTVRTILEPQMRTLSRGRGTKEILTHPLPNENFAFNQSIFICLGNCCVYVHTLFFIDELHMKKRKIHAKIISWHLHHEKNLENSKQATNNETSNHQQIHSLNQIQGHLIQYHV